MEYTGKLASKTNKKGTVDNIKHDEFQHLGGKNS